MYLTSLPRLPLPAPVAVFLILPALLLTATGLPAGESDTLGSLIDGEWERRLSENPTFASSLGDRRYNDRWPDRSLAAIARSRQSDLDLLARLQAIDADRLNAADRIDYDLFLREIETRRDRQRFRDHLLPVNQRGGIQTADELTERLRFDRVKDYEDWLTRLRSLGTYVDQTIALMRQGIADNRVHPRVVMRRVPAQITAQIVRDGTESPFYGPFRSMSENVAAAGQARLRADALAAISEIVVPAYRRFRAFFDDEYLPACRDTVGAWDFPDGADFYAFRTRFYTTTGLSPDEIHEIGLAEVARIRGEMEAIIEKVGFAGDFAAFLDFLRTDPQFYFTDPEDLLTAYLATSKRIDPELPQLFGRLPRIPYGVRAIPDNIAPDTTTAYYSRPAADGSRAGYYYVNLYRPEVRPKYEIEVLTVHEAVPGHHLQIALAQELGALPNFRRYGGFTAFVEGWALYSESLGEDLGLYRDPYSKFGQLTYEMWRAVRLVVDTGIHHKRWTRERAIEFFQANAAKTGHDIVNEIDRYIVWPGQALAYKIGELRIKALRAEAKARLGEAFDVRAFHDVVLGSGAIPLDMLDANVEGWIRDTLDAIRVNTNEGNADHD